MLLGAEVFAGDAGDFGGVEQVVGDIAGRAKFFAVAGFADQPGDIGKYIERAFGLETANAGDGVDRKSTRLNSSHIQKSRMPSSA